MNDKLASLVSSVSLMLKDQEKLAIPLLSIKLRKMAEAHPEDGTVLAVSNIVSKMEDNRKLLMSQSELKSLYSKLYVNHTKFAEYFREELGMPAETQLTKSAAQKSKPLASADHFSDPILASALACAFDKTLPVKLFAKETGEKAREIVSRNLENWNLKASKLNPVSGNEHFIVVQADYETPKGMVSILVPVELHNGKVADPNLFMGNKGPQDLNYISLRSYITTQAGTKLRASAAEMVDVLTSSITKQASISSVSLALTRLNASKETRSPFFADMVLGQTIPEQVKNAEVSLPQAGQFQSFAEKFESPLGYANLHFGVNKVNLGRDVIARALISFGLKNAQINIADANESTIVYAVALNNGHTAFNVPVKFANNRLLNPEFILCNGSALPFSKQGVQRLFLKNEKDYKAAAATSAQYGLKPNELIDNVRAAMAESNYEKAEDALNILAESGNTEAYKTAFTVFANGLSLKKEAAEQKTCSMIVKSSSSEHPVCGHTNLPVHKVYQDEHGQCHPLYRRAMNENYDGAMFMNAKIFG